MNIKTKYDIGQKVVCEDGGVVGTVKAIKIEVVPSRCKPTIAYTVESVPKSSAGVYPPPVAKEFSINETQITGLVSS